jgi:hypothetical protein
LLPRQHALRQCIIVGSAYRVGPMSEQPSSFTTTIVDAGFALAAGIV